MEDYLLYMKTLRSQMNEVEDQASKITVEEQMHLTTIQNIEKDLDLVKYETKQLKGETDNLMKSKGHICSQILEKQRKTTSMGSDASTLTQTLDLIQNERDVLSTKILEKRTYYAKVIQDITSGLKEQQTWFRTAKTNFSAEEESMTTKMDKTSGGATRADEASSGNDIKSIMTRLDAANAELSRMAIMRNDMILENRKMKQALELVKAKIDNFKPELQKMNCKMLEEELRALLSDKAGETEFLHSLQLQIGKFKGILQKVKCSCGQEYEVQLDPCK